MARSYLLIAVILLQFVRITPSQAEEGSLDLLAHRKFSELDRQLTDAQKAYENGTMSDLALLDRFNVFQRTESILQGDIDAWVAASPNSYPAHTARAVYYNVRAWNARGGAYYKDTTPTQIAGMEAGFAITRKDSLESLSLTAKPIMSYVVLLSMNRALGNDADNDDLFVKTNQEMPGNFIARREYLGGLQTRWGGSVEEMQSVVDHLRTASIPQAAKDVMQGMVLEDAGWVAEEQEQDGRKAAEYYERALSLYEAHPEMNPSCKCAREALVAIYVEANKCEQATPHLQKLLAEEPNNVKALENQAWCRATRGRKREAEQYFSRAIALGSEWAKEHAGH